MPAGPPDWRGDPNDDAAAAWGWLHLRAERMRRAAWWWAVDDPAAGGRVADSADHPAARFTRGDRARAACAAAARAYLTGWNAALGHPPPDPGGNRGS